MDVRAWVAAVWGRERFAAWLIVTAVAVAVVGFVAVVGGAIATDAPDATVSGDYDAATNTLTLTHDGESIRASETHALVVTVADNETANRHNVTWVADEAPAAASYPVTAGDTLVVDDYTVDATGDGNVFDGDATVGFVLNEGDTATVVWRGRPLGAPDARTETLGTVTVEG
jgi:hypothetical protein